MLVNKVNKEPNLGLLVNSHKKCYTSCINVTVDTVFFWLKEVTVKESKIILRVQGKKIQFKNIAFEKFQVKK